ncbi:hypothetical protein EYB31_31180 [Paenibacillus thalictri]|uniref:PA14 domain-containing protein n=1 Tax=Paenibacillus thalictri TaxID=2527873 RepID=A0A4Q9DIU5_9BACL|nr:hypothetical protein EYB31_31180 [Paenibacillus thalictri]
MAFLRAILGRETDRERVSEDALKRILSKVFCFILVIQMISSVFLYQPQKIFADPASVIKVNFQTQNLSVPAGYSADYGQTFGLHNGLQYGWNINHADSTVVRNTYQQDPLLDSFIRFHLGGRWEIEVENGEYDVAVNVGDAVYGSTNTVFVENISVWSNVYLPAGQHMTGHKSVQVSDGRITIDQGNITDERTAMNYVEITKSSGMPIALMNAPSQGTPQIAPPPERRTISGERMLISGTIINEYNAPPYTRIEGLHEEIGRYLSEKSQEVEQAIAQYEAGAERCSNCDLNALVQKISASNQIPAVVKAGSLNLDSSVVFGNPSKPVVLIIDGLNTNQKLSIDIYGTLIIKGALNANTQLTVNAFKPQIAEQQQGNLLVTGPVHLNNDSTVHAADLLYADTLTYNNGLLDVQASRITVKNGLNINTKVEMKAVEELVVGELVSNNQTANISVSKGDLFIRDNISVNNHLSIKTGGLFAVGGNMTSNQRPQIVTGAGSEGQTLLKYQLHGLKAEYFTEPDLTGGNYSKVDETVNLTAAPILPIAGFNDNQFSVRWTGQLEPRYSEAYTFDIAANGGVRLWINDELWADQWANYSGVNHQPILLEAGKRYNIKLEYSAKGNPRAIVYWQSLSQQREMIPKTNLFPFGTPVPQFSSTENSVKLQWQPVFNAGGYELEIDGKIIPLAIVSEYTHESLLPGTIHSYRMRANSLDMIGEWTPVTSYWTLPDVPGNIRLTSTSNTILLEWDEVTGAAGYEIEVNNAVIDNGSATRYEENNLNPNMQKTFRVRAKNSSGVSKWSELLVKSTIVAVPTNLKGNATDSSVRLSWDVVSGAEGYALEVDGNIVDRLQSPNYMHANLQTNTTHTYRVRAYNSTGMSNWGPYINVVTLPSVPGQLTLATSDNQIIITWKEVQGAQGYDLEVDGAVISIGIEPQYTHSGLLRNSEHTYRVRAKNDQVYGEWSAMVRGITLAGIPNNVRASTASDFVTVTWDMVTGAVAYDVEADGVVIDNGQNIEYLHKGLLPSSEHTYRVRARSAGGIGEWSSITTVKTILGHPLNIRTDVSNTSIQVTWEPVPGATSYDIFIDGELIEVGNVISYTHDQLTPFTWHVYRVRARTEAAVGEWSAALTQSTVMGTPGNIQAVPESTQITLNWDTVVGATGYEVEADGMVQEVSTGTIFVHQGLAVNSTHMYRIRARNEQGNGEWSSVQSGQTLTSGWTPTIPIVTAPDIPKNIKAEATVDSVTLTWDSVAGASGYDIEVDSLVVSNSGTTYIHNGLEPNTMHEYKVRSKNSRTQSGWSDKVQKNTVPALTVNLQKDTEFNFIIVVPRKEAVSVREITVTYAAEDMEVLDLSLLTPERETKEGVIQGTPITVSSFKQGKIVLLVQDAGKTVINGIRFLAKDNKYTQLTYTIK